MDCFFAAAEERDNLDIRGKAIAVAGAPEKRGVVSAANYRARKFGIHSAMPSARAIRLRPDLIIVPPDIEKYKRISSNIREIFFKYTGLVEPLSLDEAFLDVTECNFCKNSATLIAKEIRKKIYEAEQLTASAGISNNKFLAKVASDWNKPNGQFVISPDEVFEFVIKLPIEKIFGVGPKTGEKLHDMGIKICGDLQKLSMQDLVQKFGKFGHRLHELCRGIDHREVEPNRERKSLSVETTFVKDLVDEKGCLEELSLLTSRLEKQLPSCDTQSFRKVFIKIKFADFSSTTIETIASKINEELLKKLLRDGLTRGNGKSVRLLGLGIRFSNLGYNEQLCFL